LELFEGKSVSVKFRRQHPTSLYVLDFYCHELKLAIELDGSIMLSKKLKNDEIRDNIKRIRDKVIRFNNPELLKKLQRY
jgi:cyclase